jgi:signal transduction histidine kinase
VVTNLLSNAIKYGLGKPIEVEIERAGAAARLRVTDHGIGMSREVADKVFQPFERGVSARHYGGLGLGLHIVRSVVGALGGSVGVQSAPGVGSTFVVELPIARVARSEEARDAHPAGR